jgi:hypothetical protein
MQESIEVIRTELKERLILDTDSAKAYTWHLEIDSGRIWTTAKAKEFFNSTIIVGMQPARNARPIPRSAEFW